MIAHWCTNYVYLVIFTKQFKGAMQNPGVHRANGYIKVLCHVVLKKL